MLSWNGEVQIGYWEKFIVRESDQTLEKAEWGDGITNHGGQEPWRCGT